MEHIVNITFTISDDDIERGIKTQMTKAAKEKVESALSQRRYYDEDDKVIELAKEEINKFITANSNEIVEKMVAAVVESLPRRKFFKDAVKEAINE